MIYLFTVSAVKSRNYRNLGVSLTIIKRVYFFFFLFCSLSVLRGKRNSKYVRGLDVIYREIYGILWIVFMDLL